MTIAAARRITDRGGGDRGHRDGAGDAARRDRPADRRPGRLRRDRGRSCPTGDDRAARRVAGPRRGAVGVAYGAPRLRADRVDVGRYRDCPGAARPPWRARTRRRNGGSCESAAAIESVHKLGDRWRAEIRVGSTRVVVVGQPGAGIAVTRRAEGRTATVTGIVRRPYPSATDRRFSVLPRFPADVDVGRVADPAGCRCRRGPVRTRVRRRSGRPGAARPPGADSPAPPPEPSTPTSSTSPRSSAQLVRVGGLVVDLDRDGFTLDDGTSVGRVVAAGEALPSSSP